MSKPDQTGDTANISQRLLQALTQQEIAQLIDALLGVLTPQLQTQAIAQLPPDTQQTLEQILTPGQPETPSLAKQEQTWSELWGAWNDIVWEAAQEEGNYITQEVEWEPPYFDTTAFTEDLEKVAAQMLPLIPTAFEHNFTPEGDFVTALLEAETDILAEMPDWMGGFMDGLYIDSQVTQCVLQWEWLTTQAQGQDAFAFVQQLRQHEQQFQEIDLADNAILAFLTQLPPVAQQNIFAGLTANQDTPPWKQVLKQTHSHWHLFYLELIGQYAPERYLDNLRQTIPQQWRNGLPIIEDLLEQQNYAESQIVIEETLQSLLKSCHSDPNWTPETSLLVATLKFHQADESVRTLLRFYQQTAQGLNQPERANALTVQQLALTQWFNWSRMLQAFSETALPAPIQQALFTSWRDYVARQSKPRTAYGYGYGTQKTVDSWWVPWLLESLADDQKGKPWFQQQLTQWLTHLPREPIQLGENYDVLRLLTKDLTQIQAQGNLGYPHFEEIVIRPDNLSSQDEPFRQDYLQQSASPQLLAQVMDYWRAILVNLVPKPELVAKSDYTTHARWMLALKELCPQDYDTLLAQWREVHQRRRNLWKAMQEVGLM